MISEFTLPRAKQTATIDVLNSSHLPQVLGLLEATRAALPEDQKMFVLPQPAAYFEKLLARKNGFMLGIHAQGQLIAQIAVMGPLTMEEAIACNAITRNPVEFHHAEMHDLIVVAKSMAVHPEWRGNELSQHIVQAMIDMPSARAADHVFAQISVENTRSWELFVRHGFSIAAAAIDPTDNKPRFVLQKPAMGFDFYNASTVYDIDPITDFSSIMRLTGYEALVGKFDDDENGKLAFYACGDNAASWTDQPAKLAR